MRSHLAKVTSKRQLTIPAWAMEELGWPTHFRLAVVQGNLERAAHQLGRSWPAWRKKPVASWAVMVSRAGPRA